MELVGYTYGTMVRLLLVMLPLMSKWKALVLAPLLLIEPPAYAYTRRQQIMAQMLWSLPFMWKAKTEFWAPGLDPALVVVGILIVNQWIEDFPFSVSPFLFFLLSL